MSLIYRAIWQDEAEHIHERALDAFAWWVNLRHPGPRHLAPGVAENVAGAHTLVQAGSEPAGAIQRCRVHVDDGTDRLTTTLVTTSTAAGTGSVWVDSERVTHRAFASFRVQPPELSTRLIADGVRPHRGPVPLAVTPTALHAYEAPRLATLLGKADRDLPVVVMTPGPDFDARSCRDAGTHAARVLAGSAAVFLVGPAGRVDLGEILGPDLVVAPGAARVYLPGVSPNEPNPWRHRQLDPDRVRRAPGAVPSTIIELLAPAIAARRAPAEYPELRRLLDVDTAAIASEHARMEARIADLEDQLARAEDHSLELVADLEDAEGRVNLLQAALARAPGGSRTGTPDATSAPPDVDGLVAAATAAQRHLHGIVLPDTACRDLEELDRTIEAGAWGRTAWRGLLALNAFALDTAFEPGFWEWCRADRSPFAWPASKKKLAMRESQTVMTNEALRAKRLFCVDEAVQPEGRIEMQAHLKIAEGGNHLIPRIYFHDDRHGVTHKVHIGFFGPHRFVPNTLT